MATLKFYQQRLGPKLREAIERQLEDSNETDRLKLDDELTLLREASGDAVSLYSNAIELGDATAITIAKQLMEESFEKVANLALKASRIRSECKDSISPNQLGDVVSQICRFVYQVFGDQFDKIQQFDHLISTTLRLPTLGNQGTLLTPDMDAALMDDTIPATADLVDAE
jgi:hypothetical protein